ncbi:potassium channel family protein [Anaerotalea alkaliphila]|uniref:Two pore domain potassium channel family protein n=1 Tax=Anaerotalea alkaliphila TaxID=2662126 RepID=A0A7X5KNN3_9FIRM|nr:potassium channel family protein [Anaerotalea alkaliphila]NDL67968.1 two pore domain potassium channel family protein [Anaerotalea alkaliphila]
MEYVVKMEERPFELFNGFSTPRTVRVESIHPEEKSTKVQHFGWMTPELFKEYHALDKDVMLKDVYFQDFDIHLYRDLFYRESLHYVDRFHAERCFFDGDSHFGSTVFGKGGFSLAHSTFGNGKVDFSKSTFESEAVYFSGIRFGCGEKLFTSTVFLGNSVNFFSTDFSDGHVNFKTSNFENAHLNFSGAIFGDGDVDFDFSRFGSLGTDFTGVCFGDGLISFRNCNFNSGDLLLFGSRFGQGKVTFSDAVFGDCNVDFSFCHFKKTIFHFKYAKLGYGRFAMNNIRLEEGYVLFKSVEFKSKSVNFSDSVIDKIHFWNSIFNEHVNMAVRKCNRLTLENCIIEKTFDMISTTKRKVEIQCLNLMDTRNLGMIYVDWDLNDVKQMIYAQGKSTSHLDKAHQFRLLKENFHEIGHYKDEDRAYVEHKRCEALAELKGEDLVHVENKGRITLLRRLQYPFRWFVLDFIGNYATNPFRILGTLVLTILAFTFIYLLPFVELDGRKSYYVSSIVDPQRAAFMTALYHSIATIFTIGYGDVNPGNGISMFLSGFEGFIGLFLMAYFTVAFLRKTLR